MSKAFVKRWFTVLVSVASLFAIVVFVARKVSVIPVGKTGFKILSEWLSLVIAKLERPIGRLTKKLNEAKPMTYCFGVFTKLKA